MKTDSFLNGYLFLSVTKKEQKLSLFTLLGKYIARSTPPSIEMDAQTATEG